MAEHNDLGKIGEKIACDYLQEKGYSIITVNWRYRKAEIDIIAKSENQIVFVEVKTRGEGNIDDPLQAVNKTKQKLLVKAADAYIQENNINFEARFDIITIEFKNKKPIISHTEDAFYALL